MRKRYFRWIKASAVLKLMPLRAMPTSAKRLWATTIMKVSALESMAATSARKTRTIGHVGSPAW